MFLDTKKIHLCAMNNCYMFQLTQLIWHVICSNDNTTFGYLSFSTGLRQLNYSVLLSKHKNIYHLQDDIHGVF